MDANPSVQNATPPKREVRRVPYMRVLVTGGAGFIGSHIMERWISPGEEVTVVDNLSTGHRRRLRPCVRLIALDIRLPDVGYQIKRARPEAIVHAAARGTVRASARPIPERDDT